MENNMSSQIPVISVRASSYDLNGGGHPPTMAVDGDEYTYWGTDTIFNPGNLPQWLKLDLGSSRTVNKTIIQFPTVDGTYTYEVATSTDNVSFTTVVTSRTGSGTVTNTFTSHSARYIRLTITANTVANTTHVNDFSVYYSTTKRVATAVTASYSDPAHPPTMATDTSATTYWGTDSVSPGVLPQWLELDLGSIKDISEIVTHFYDADGRSYTYNIEVSNDQTNWTLAVASKTASGTVTDSFSSSPILSYPTDRWQRIWYTLSDVLLGETPDEVNIQFDNNWIEGVLAYGLTDNIQFSSSRTINFPASGNYIFTIGSDDGVKLWIDDVLLLDQWIGRAYTEDSVTVNLSAGNHKFRLDYFEGVDVAHLKFMFTAEAIPTVTLTYHSSPVPVEITINGSQVFPEGTALITSIGQWTVSVPTQIQTPSSVQALIVVGKDILNTSGKPVILRGLNEPDFANNADGSVLKISAWTDDNAKSEITLIKSWGSTIIRCFIAVDLWKNDMIDSKSVIHCRDALKRYISFASEQGMYVLLTPYTLKSSQSIIDQGLGTQAFQDPLPYPPYQSTPGGATLIANQQDFVDFWTTIATELQSYPNVLFELWNEPQIWSPADLTAWLGVTQQCITAIRAAGSQSLIVISGNNAGSAWVNLDGPWTDDLSWVFNNPLTGGNLVYSVHLYRYSNHIQISGGKAYLRTDVDNGLRIMRYYDVAAQHPLIVSEIAPQMDIDTANELTFFRNALSLQPTWYTLYCLGMVEYHVI
jgi:hypothetical protein